MQLITRVFPLSLLLALAGCTGVAFPTAPKATLGGLYKLTDFPIGGAVNMPKMTDDPRALAIIDRDFNRLTATNAMKMYSIVQADGRMDFSKPDAFVRLAEVRGKRVFGHTLVWHYGLPGYVEALDREAMEAYLGQYIDTVVTRYRGRVDGWDVVNEAFEDAGGGLRDTPWLQKMGKDYIALAFRAAHVADPEAKLFINDFSTESDTAKLGALLRLVEDLRADNVPIDGIGFQMHLRMDTDEAQLGASLARAAATGLLIHLSELDIIFNRHDDAQRGRPLRVTEMTPQLLEAQAKKYETVARLYRENVPPAQRYGITFWSFTDRDTWIRGFFKLQDWPTLFDEDLERKPAYYGFARGLTD